MDPDIQNALAFVLIAIGWFMCACAVANMIGRWAEDEDDA